jgi:hypothetical protein
MTLSGEGNRGVGGTGGWGVGQVTDRTGPIPEPAQYAADFQLTRFVELTRKAALRENGTRPHGFLADR